MNLIYPLSTGIVEVLDFLSYLDPSDWGAYLQILFCCANAFAPQNICVGGIEELLIVLFHQLYKRVRIICVSPLEPQYSLPDFLKGQMKTWLHGLLPCSPSFVTTRAAHCLVGL